MAPLPLVKCVLVTFRHLLVSVLDTLVTSFPTLLVEDGESHTQTVSLQKLEFEEWKC